MRIVPMHFSAAEPDDECGTLTRSSQSREDIDKKSGTAAGRDEGGDFCYKQIYGGILPLSFSS